MSESGSGKIGQHRDQDRHRQRRGKGDDRGCPVQPGRRLRHDDLLVEQLPEIAIGLEDAGPLAPLHPLLELQDDALKQRREQQGRRDLGDLQKDVARRSSPTASNGSGAHAKSSDEMADSEYRDSSPALVCHVGSTGVISPEGGYKANSIAIYQAVPRAIACQEGNATKLSCDTCCRT